MGLFMLVLTRKPDETIIINEKIKITVVEVEGNKVKLGVDAPPEIAIYREEILEDILQENLAASRLRIIRNKQFSQQLKEFFQESDKKDESE